MTSYPRMRQVVLDTVDVRGLAEFYRELLGLSYRAGDEPSDGGGVPERDWLVLVSDAGAGIAFQQVDELPASTWPTSERPQMLHLDLTVPTKEDLDEQHERVMQLGARVLFDRSHDPVEPLCVYADPAGHPFCIFVADD